MRGGWHAGYGDTIDIECGQNGCNASREECQPIVVPTSDPAFSAKNCLEFVRSQPVPNLNCTMGKVSFVQNSLTIISICINIILNSEQLQIV